MELKTKGLYSRWFLFLGGSELFLFIAFYLTGFILEYSTALGIIDYVRYFLNDLFNFMLPCIISTLALTDVMHNGVKGAAIGAIPLVLSNLIYSIPYYYLYHVYSGFDSAEAIVISLFVSLAICLATYLFCGVLTSLGFFVLKKLSSRHDTDPTRALHDVKSFDFGAPQVAASASMVFLVFFADLAEEIINAVSYLKEYAGTYRTSEVVYIVFCFLFLIVKLLIGHYALIFVRKSIIKNRGSIASSND